MENSSVSVSYSENKFFIPDDIEESDPNPDEIVDDEADDDTGLRKIKPKSTEISVKVYNASMKENEIMSMSDDIPNEMRTKLIKKYKDSFVSNREGTFSK
jgi:hypothetical protein